MSEYQAFPIATALKETLKEGYTKVRFKADFKAAIVVALVALPLSMALSIAVGLPPQHGIYTAIIAGFFIALLGGSKVAVNGPTAAFVVVLAPIVETYGLRGLIWCQIMAGIMLIASGTMKFGKYIKYVPHAVITGFTSGIAVVIFTLSLKDFMGLPIKKFGNEYLQKLGQIIHAIPQTSLSEAAIGVVALVIILFGARVIKSIPSPLIGVFVAAVIAYILSLYGINVETILSRFSYESAGQVISGIPPYPPVFHIPGESSQIFEMPTKAEFFALTPSAIIIAILAALETLLSASIADNMTGQKHDPNAELNALGIGNVITALFVGIPATGALARTSTNILSGANSPFAAAMHSIIILLFILFLTPLINFIPMASLSALLIVVAIKMSHYKQFIGLLKLSPWHEKIVLLASFIFTVVMDMVAGLSVGVVLYIIFRLLGFKHTAPHHHEV